MKKHIRLKAGIFICLLMTSISLKAQENIPIPQGFWQVVQISIEKNIDNKIEKNVYDKAEDVKSIIQCPQLWIVNEKEIIIRYTNGIEDIVENKLEDGKLTVFSYDGILLSYQCSLIDGTLVLNITHDYIMFPTGEAKKITEKRIITLKRQTTNE